MKTSASHGYSFLHHEVTLSVGGSRDHSVKVNHGAQTVIVRGLT